MYANMLLVHSWLRWFTLLMCAGAIVYAARPVRPGVSTLPGKTWDTYLMLAVDLQMLVGLILYFGLSDFTRAAMENFDTAVREPSVRYWAIIHAGGMFSALFLVRVGRVLAMNAPTPAIAQRRRLIWFVIATLMILATMPWPGLANARPLFRW